MTSRDMYTYQDAGALGLSAGVEIAGYSVEAIDGGIGKVDEATYEVGSSYIVVDTGPWIFGKKVLLPAGVIDRVDSAEETVYVNRTKDQDRGFTGVRRVDVPRRGLPHRGRGLLRTRGPRLHHGLASPERNRAPRRPGSTPGRLALTDGRNRAALRAGGAGGRLRSRGATFSNQRCGRGSLRRADTLGDLPSHPAEERIPPLVHAHRIPPIALTETSPGGRV